MRTVHVENEYDVPPEKLWAIVTDYDALAFVMKGMMSFEGLPKGRTHTGQKMTVMVSLFGKLPAQPYHMEVLECDDDAMILRSCEHGAGVKSWRHTLSVSKTATGCTLTDTIEIDAGALTFIFALWARFLYQKRHKPRLVLLGLAGSS